MPLQECWEAKARIMDIAREDPEASTLERALEMSQFELSLVVAKNAFEQWVVRCGAAAGANGFETSRRENVMVRDLRRANQIAIRLWD